MQSLCRDGQRNVTMPNRILIVENDREVGESLMKVLLQAGYGTAIASDIDSAAEALRTNRYEVLLLDLDLPDSTGWDLLDYCAVQHLPLPVILYTSFLDQCETGILPGKGALLEKPLDPVLLLNFLGTHTANGTTEPSQSCPGFELPPAAIASVPASSCARMAAGF